jgi:hypothetical protein
MIRFLLLTVLVVLLAGCQSDKKTAAVTVSRDNTAAIAALQTINTSAQKCWSGSQNKDFRKYRIIPELDTRVGKPRILVVSAKAAQGLPQYVIEADGTPARISAYGPLGAEPLGEQMNADVMRWHKGEKGCKA